MTVTGGVLLLYAFGVIHPSWGIIWPVLVIVWGVWLLAQAMGFSTGCCGKGGMGTLKEKMGAFGKRMGALRTTTADSRCDVSVCFGSMKRRITTGNFQGGKLAAVFAEADVDLSDAEIAGDEAVIHADAVFGAHKIRVPRNWDVLVRGTAVFGEFLDKTDHRAPAGAPAKRLIVNGSAVFGSVVIRD